MTVACYVRVSTEEQNLERQLSATHDYAVERLGADLGDVETYRDTSTGTDTAREGYRAMMAAVEAGDVDAVIIKSISRIARSIRDLDRTVERMKTAGVAVHFIDEALVMKPDEDDPYQNALFRLLGVFAELEAEIIQKRTREGIAARRNSDEYHHGPPPLGFVKEDGRLIEADDYDRVVTVLEQVARGEESKRAAARELDTSRKTIRRALDRGELYGL